MKEEMRELFVILKGSPIYYSAYQLHLQDLGIKSVSEIQNSESLKFFKLLGLSCNKIQKLDNLEKFEQLERLDLDDNEIQEISGLLGLNKLQKLNLSTNKLRNIQGLDSLVNLKSLDLSWNNITEIKGFEHLKNLEELNLLGNNISEIYGLENLHKLHKLQIGVNKITEIKGLENLVNLIKLCLGSRGDDIYPLGNQITEIKGLDTLKNLVYLDLSKNKIREIRGLESLVNLEYLDLSHNEIHELKGIPLSKKLHFINLEGNKIDHFIDLKKLMNTKYYDDFIFKKSRFTNLGEIRFLSKEGVVLTISFEWTESIGKELIDYKNLIQKIALEELEIKKKAIEAERRIIRLKEIELILKNLYPKIRYVKKDAWIPVLEEGNDFIEDSKFSGIPLLNNQSQWPICKTCGISLQLLFQLNLDDAQESNFIKPQKFQRDLLGNRVKKFGSGFLQLFVCRNCLFEKHLYDSFLCRVINQVKNITPIEIPHDIKENYYPSKKIVSWKYHEDYPHFRELDHFGIELSEEEFDLFRFGEPFFNIHYSHKLGGWPYWDWEMDRLNEQCPICGREMQFLFQIILDYRYFPEFPGGIGYIFQCPTHLNSVKFLYLEGSP